MPTIAIASSSHGVAQLLTATAAELVADGWLSTLLRSGREYIKRTSDLCTLNVNSWSWGCTAPLTPQNVMCARGVTSTWTCPAAFSRSAARIHSHTGAVDRIAYTYPLAQKSNSTQRAVSCSELSANGFALSRIDPSLGLSPPSRLQQLQHLIQ